MIQLDFGVLIDRLVEQVFQFLARPSNLPRWQSMVAAVKQVSSDPVALGTTFVAEGEILGRKMENTMKVVEFTPNEKFGYEGRSGPMVIRLAIALKPAGTGTHLSVSGQAEPGGVFKVAENVLAGQVRKQMETNLQALKTLLESGAA
jgi:uncharacterized membrane protein